jgi:hypothetical protein
MTDAAAYFGYFNRDNQVAKFDRARSDAFSPVASTMGVAIADSSAVGYYFTPQVTSAGPGGGPQALRGLPARWPPSPIHLTITPARKEVGLSSPTDLESRAGKPDLLEDLLCQGNTIRKATAGRDG